MRIRHLNFVIILMAIFLYVNQSMGQRIIKVANAAEADVKVFITSNSVQADIKVKVVSNAEEVNRDGQWYIMLEADDSTLKVYETVTASEADVIVYYVTIDKQVGWVNTEKKHFFIKNN